MSRRGHLLPYLITALIALCASASLPVQASPMSQTARCFRETKYCLEGRFLQYWNQHGGLPIFGYPIAPPAEEHNPDQDRPVRSQWLERNRFELHPENAPPYDVLLGRLGAERLAQQGRDWRTFPRAQPNAPNYFPETGHAIAHPPFWRFWSGHGLEFDGRPGFSFAESLALFGMPLSEPMIETNSSGDRVLTQWFERARFEDHGAGGVKLGLLGNEARTGAINAGGSDPARLAWFYRPPGDGTRLETIRATFSDYILTHRDEWYRDQLLEQGVPRERIFQYIAANEIHDPGSCTTRPWGNQYAFKPGDFCRIAREHPDWFLLDSDGRLICYNNWGARFCLMDPGHPGWQQFALERTHELNAGHGWWGVFLDNIDGSLQRAGGRTRQYGDDSSYQAAVERYLTFLRSNYYAPLGRPLMGNLALRRDDEIWYRYLQHFEGVMEEGCITTWQGGYLRPHQWEAQIDKLERTQALGKTVICVAQGRRDDRAHQRFAYASYLLAANGRAAFRYTSHESHGEFWNDDSYAQRLGAARGPRYRDGAGWRRDFERGSVFVDPVANTAAIRVDR